MVGRERVQVKPRAVAAAAASTGTVVGAGAPDRAQSGSFRPLPVIVQTTREPAGIRPSADAASRPATLADEPSSPNTASSRAMIRYAARISLSVTLSIAPPD